MRTVREITFDLFRKLGLTTIVGNPGSTEEPFLPNFPSDFDYVLALQETSAVAVADGLSQSLRRPVLVNLHTGAGTGNAMGAIVTAYLNKTPLIVTAGQQTREMLLIEPLLTNIDATVMPRPWVKWSYEPARAEDVPAAFMRAYATALQPPAGPVYLSLPLDDWEKLIPEVQVFRTVASRQGPDPTRIRDVRGAHRRQPQPRARLRLGHRPQPGLGCWNRIRRKARRARLDRAIRRAHAVPGDPSAVQGRARAGHRAVVAATGRTRPRGGVGAQVFRYYPSCPAPTFRPAPRCFMSPTTRRSRQRRRSETA